MSERRYVPQGKGWEKENIIVAEVVSLAQSEGTTHLAWHCVVEKTCGFLKWLGKKVTVGPPLAAVH
jgi:hypothetical protein